MKAATIKEIKTELKTLHPDRLRDLCLHMAKFRKENKELLTYLLFEAQDEKLYVKEIKSQIDELFKVLPIGNSYHAKKSIRKILRNTKKYIKYSGSKQTEVELLIYFCQKLRKSGISLPVNTTLGNMYLRQFQKIKKTIATLHEDLQFDYSEELRLL